MNWDDFARLASGPVTVTVRGLVHGVEPPTAEAVQFAPPDFWWVEDGDRHLRYLANDRGHYRWRPGRASVACFQPRREGCWQSGGMSSPDLIRPRDLLHPDGDFTSPLGPVESVRFLDRPAWQVLLAPPPHKSAPIRQVVDAASGITLAYRSADRTDLLAFSAVTTGLDLPPGTFDGPADPSAPFIG